MSIPLPDYDVGIYEGEWGGGEIRCSPALPDGTTLIGKTSGLSDAVCARAMELIRMKQRWNPHYVPKHEDVIQVYEEEKAQEQAQHDSRDYGL